MDAETLRKHRLKIAELPEGEKEAVFGVLNKAWAVGSPTEVDRVFARNLKFNALSRIEGIRDFATLYRVAYAVLELHGPESLFWGNFRIAMARCTSITEFELMYLFPLKE